MSSLRRQSGPHPAPEPPVQTQQQRQHADAPRKSKNPPPPAHAVFGRDTLRPLMKSDDNYLSPEYVQKWAVTCGALDFDRGTPLDPITQELDPRATIFMRPVPYDKMEKAINDKKPWICALDGEIMTLHWDECLDDWWHATSISDLLDTYLRTHHMGNDLRKPALGVVYDTDWVGRCAPSEYKLDRDDEVAKWSLHGLWRRTTPHHPHLTCFLADRAPLRDDSISTAEMRNILTLSCSRALDDGHHHHKRIPVTVVSASGKKLRVLVGVVVDTGSRRSRFGEGPLSTFQRVSR